MGDEALEEKLGGQWPHTYKNFLTTKALFQIYCSEALDLNALKQSVLKVDPQKIDTEAADMQAALVKFAEAVESLLEAFGHVLEVSRLEDLERSVSMLKQPAGLFDHSCMIPGRLAMFDASIKPLMKDREQALVGHYNLGSHLGDMA